MSEARLEAAEDRGVDVFGFVARFAPLLFLILLMLLFAIMEPRFLSEINLFNVMRQVSIGGMSAFRGAALLFAAGGPISGFQPSFTWWGQGKIGPVPVPVIIFLLAALIAHIVLRYTRYG